MRKYWCLCVAFLVVVNIGSMSTVYAQEQILAWDGEVAAQYAFSLVRLNGPDGEGVATVNRETLRRIVETKNRISEAANQPAHLYILSGTEPNAFAWKNAGAPQIAINVAMIDLLGDDFDAYTAIIGHELAHLVRDHGATRESREGARNAISTVLGTALRRYGIPLGGTIANVGTTAVSRVFSRDEEREADSLGLGYMKQAGNDPMGGVRAWERMGTVAKSRGLPFLSTHPAPEGRLEAMRKLASNSVAAAPISLAIASNAPQPRTIHFAAAAFVNTERVFATLRERYGDQKASLEAANRAVKLISEKSNIHLVFQTAVWASPRIEITDEIIHQVEGKSVDYEKLRNLGQPVVAFVDAIRVVKMLDGRHSDKQALLVEANRTIRRIAEKGNIDIVFQKAVWVSPRIDITGDVINEIEGKAADYNKLRNLSQIPMRLGFVSTEKVFKDSPLAQRAQRRVANEPSLQEQELKSSVEAGNLVIKQIAEVKDFIIIFQEAVYASPSIDITPEVMRRMQ